MDSQLQLHIEQLAALPTNALQAHPKAREIFAEFKYKLNTGQIRSAEKIDGVWKVHQWVKQGILLGFRLGELQKVNASPPFSFVDKDTYPTQQFTPDQKVRIVPGGTTVRDGAYLAPSVVVMPPAYINVGAFVDAGTMIDSHALVGSCAQVGKNVHLSAGSQLGGVLEPVGALPVIIEDGVMIGGNCGIYEGTIVEERAVIGTGVILNGSTPVYDVVNGRILRKTATSPLVIPKGAVVVAGSRPVTKNAFAEAHGLSIYTPLIIKYRDEKTDLATALEELLR
ncbi:MAG: 2,3,4,5-tetrahydropyridine-2,6-dicarboxylate N-succinyltransferase [Chloroherpetonaceae bacterium]|nr:2,3,4,5-tetrahydropyridine-2,6-dicarboxylate N-succinyltransferase [Chloroherpetonaceae bacterium]MCS7210341.1 2,3,4,5-tetrahydropyridine-2,6-dicarboxylate N-succinyltransferase [Chloroherpetonaceae bacterium]MDW8019080.1 2,3,4,5-tetrahydropyridine-2,6-dicarboxylate N-succinyltransferase [Chloroherpetonaceae bacterium]MDW8465548.1 2,3,4,5-tetrahydropyridine-2,6-dicarboxylate N-succinyltransferase [Chloroherpetonaceae bacterium]